jgi:hypothetical protein
MPRIIRGTLAVLLAIIAALTFSGTAVNAAPAAHASELLLLADRAAGPANTALAMTPQTSNISFETHGIQPVRLNGALVYRNVQPGVSYVQRYAKPYGKQTLLAINRPSAPTDYSFRYNDLPAGGHIETATGGGIIVKDRSDNLVGLLAPAWAKDANLKPVVTQYHVTDAKAGIFVQRIAHQQPGVAYPVIADPLSLQIRYPGIRGWWGPNGLEIRFNNYLTGLIFDGGLAITAYVTGGGELVIAAISRYSATAAKFIPWISHSTAVWAITNNKCLGYTLPIYWWGPNWYGQRYWLENC